MIIFAADGGASWHRVEAAGESWLMAAQRRCCLPFSRRRTGARRRAGAPRSRPQNDAAQPLLTMAFHYAYMLQLIAIFLLPALGLLFGEIFAGSTVSATWLGQRTASSSRQLFRRCRRRLTFSTRRLLRTLGTISPCQSREMAMTIMGIADEYYFC